MTLTVRTPVLDIACEAQGDPAAPAIVLAHGFPDDVRAWDRVVPALVAAGYRTLAPYTRGFGGTRFRDPQAMRSGQIAALGQDLLAFIDAMGLARCVVVGHDWRARAAYVAAVAAPERIAGLVALSVGYATSSPAAQISIDQAHSYWYQWYFATPRGERALTDDRHAFCRYLWQVWAPNWPFTDAEYDATAKAFDNPDFIAVTMHSYRQRWGFAPDDPAAADLHARMLQNPKVAVPTTMLHGDADGATRPETSAGKDAFFTAGYRREVLPGIGHFIQREAPQAVIDATLAHAARLRTPANGGAR